MEKGNFVREFAAGNIGGLMGIVAVYPLDTAKIRLQVNPAYRSIRHVLKSMWAADGVSSSSVFVKKKFSSSVVC